MKIYITEHTSDAVWAGTISSGMAATKIGVGYLEKCGTLDSNIYKTIQLSNVWLSSRKFDPKQISLIFSFDNGLFG